MSDGMAIEGLPEEVEDAIDAVMEKITELSDLLDRYGYETGTALISIARDELVEALRAEHDDREQEE